MKFILLTLTGISILFMVGCQTAPYQGEARDVKRKPQTEGIVAIKMNHRDEDRQKADEKMKSNCAPYPVQVLEEGEVAIGETTKTDGKETNRASTESSTRFLGMNLASGEASGKNVSSSATTTKVKEWQISYKCERKPTAKR
jgi:hypothetical protein